MTANEAFDHVFQLLSELIDPDDWPRIDGWLLAIGRGLEVAPTSGALPADSRESLKWCAAALQAVAKSATVLEESSFRLIDTGESKSLKEILDEADAALASREAAPNAAGEDESWVIQGLMNDKPTADDGEVTVPAHVRNRAVHCLRTAFKDIDDLLEEREALEDKLADALASPQVAPEPTDEQLNSLMTMDFDGKVIKQVNFKRNEVRRIVRQAFALAAAPVAPTPAQPSEDARDAARYRWLRRQQWEKASLFVVSGGRASIRLGTYCPTVERLDDLIDAALSAPKGEEEKP